MQAVRQAKIFLLGTGLFLSPLLAQTDDEVVWEWVREAVEPVTTSLVETLRIAPERGVAQQFEWQVVVTAEDGWGLTWSAVVLKPWKGHVQSRYFDLREHNLDRQLFRLRAANVHINAADTLDELDIESGAVESADCNGLASLARELESTAVQVVPDNALRLHAPGYRVRLTTAHREAREYFVYADEGDLASWCKELHSTLRRCNGRRPN